MLSTVCAAAQSWYCTFSWQVRRMDQRPLFLLKCSQRSVPSGSSRGSISPTSGASDSVCHRCCCPGQERFYFQGGQTHRSNFAQWFIVVAQGSVLGPPKTHAPGQFLFCSWLGGNLSVCCAQHRYTSADWDHRTTWRMLAVQRESAMVHVRL